MSPVISRNLNLIRHKRAHRHIRLFSLHALKRNESFAKMSADHVTFFKDSLGPNRVITDAAELQSFNTDWIKRYRGNSSVAIMPSSSNQVSKVLKYCNNHRIAVVPQGGNTGLVGGSVPVFDELILSTSKMNQIISFDEASGILVCEAGCILENLDTYLKEHGYIMPLDLGAKGSCQIGGNVSTNAGGIRLLRYGSLHGNVMGLETVLPDGTILDTLSTLRKDNTGYDLKQIFVGAEGTLGVVTKVAILAARKPKSVHTFMLGVDTFEKVVQVQQAVRSELSEIVSAIEFFDRPCLQHTLKNLAGTRNPLSSVFTHHVLVETHGSETDHDQEKIMKFLESLFEQGLAEDGTMAQDESQASNMWVLREGITESLLHDGFIYKYDISTPIRKMLSFVDELTEKVGTRGKVYCYGHVGDGNLHLNVTSSKFDSELSDDIESIVYPRVGALNGSISAEHGVGQMKASHLNESKSPNAIEMMFKIKQLFDPKGIMNPYKVLPY
eukprot:183546_1